MTAITTKATVVAKETHVSTTVDGETVVLNNETGTYQGLQGVGPDIWELVQEPITVDAIVERIAADYDVDEHRCERDVRQFLHELADESLIEIDDSPAE